MVWIDYTLYDLTAYWRFPGSPGLGQWLDQLPWLNEGGVCTILCASINDYSVIAAAVERQLHAAQAGRTDLRVIQVDSGADEAPLAACLATLDIEASGARLRVANALAQAINAQPTLFLIHFVGAHRLEWWEILSDFADTYRKHHSTSPLTMVILSTAPIPSIRPQFDFRQGWPEGIDLWSEGLGIRDRWAGYRYLRTAWESAGSLAIAEDLEQQTQDLLLGDDETLEKHFNSHAQERFNTVDLAAPVWTQLISNYGYRHPRPQSNEWTRPPALWWTPPHSIGQRLAPWACRAALLKQAGSGCTDWKLRNELICEPLAHELFALCQQGEALIRTRIFWSGLKQSPSDEARQLWERFSAEENGNSSYPASHPAPPGDAWSFASLGEVIKAARSQRLPDPFWNLLLLRNSIGHGHFVGWRQVTTLINFMGVVQ